MDKRPPAYTYLCLHSSFNSPTTILVLIGEQFFVSSVRIQSRLPDGMPAHRELDVKARWRTLQKVTLNVQHGHVLEVGPDQVAAKQIPAELPKWLLFCLFLIIPFLIPLSFSIKGLIFHKLSTAENYFSTSRLGFQARFSPRVLLLEQKVAG